MKCPICKDEGGRTYIIKEMMFGTAQEYPYKECNHCGCLYLTCCNISQEDLYPADKYYSFKNKDRYDSRSTIRSLLRKSKYSYYLWNRNILGKLMLSFRPVRENIRWIKSAKLKSFNSRILDVGCGTGTTLRLLRSMGFKNLYGVDPYVTEDIIENNLNIKRGTIAQISDKYDFIMFHHVVEHNSNPHEILRQACDKLTDNGVILIRTPIKDCTAWNTYGVNWVQIDAPRHCVVLSLKALEMLINSCRMKIIDKYYDSTEFQFWGSEQYLNGIGLNASNSYAVDKGKSIFTNDKILEYRRRATLLNDENKGDQIAIIVGCG